ncbi:uncharacterized protein LOC111603168 [Drosophila hydei]|uniref:Uncharacterized protein LOC111603168 n=1 Tax=Drosophila hydei TaxID=7224 RepID=A0A6J1M892_DROHY|nr:uncharacterized protein LOC111603168 [Drosophila hydei]
MKMKIINVIMLGILLPWAQSYASKILQLKEGTPCLDRKSVCKLANDCITWHAYKDQHNTLISCGFEPLSGRELHCCPNRFPKAYVPPTTSTPLPPTTPPPHHSTVIQLSNFKHLVPILYLSKHLDYFDYHCTAIILSPTRLLTTSRCVGPNIAGTPSRIAVGVTDPRVNYDEELEYEIKSGIKQMNKDLALLELHTAIDFSDKLMENASIAVLCHADELAGQPKLYAVGFAQNEATNCGLFKLRLERLSDCRVPELSRPVTGINTNATHICVRAMPETSPRLDGCKNCLTATSSVLHVERSDGSLCVAGIATPTTDECTVNSDSTLYTIFVNRAFKAFLGLPIAG